MTGTDVHTVLHEARTHALDPSFDVGIGALDVGSATDHWVLAPDSLRLLALLVEGLRPRHVLEFGSGASTHVLARLAAQHDLLVTSIDHDPTYAVDVDDLDRSGRHCVRLQVVPLVLRSRGFDLAPTYLFDEDLFASREAVDLALIDGPPELLGGRGGTLFQIAPLMRAGGICILDDANRPNERRALQQWQEDFGDAIEVIHLSGFEHGVAAIIVHQPIAADDLASHLKSVKQKHIEAVVPETAPVIVQDDQLFTSAPFIDRPLTALIVDEHATSKAPANDEEAREALRRHHADGVRYVAVLEPAFWQFEYLSQFTRYLMRNAEVVASQSRLVILKLIENPR